MTSMTSDKHDLYLSGIVIKIITIYRTCNNFAKEVGIFYPYFKFWVYR